MPGMSAGWPQPDESSNGNEAPLVETPPGDGQTPSEPGTAPSTGTGTVQRTELLLNGSVLASGPVSSGPATTLTASADAQIAVGSVLELRISEIPQ
ncbi:hypothetical protein [Nocardia sp. NPDC052566]|uniref:hypothetical protein n=1 Tax=Nocardia sp. NPDC052566 TaxID=3364330 RepID=UPI0037C5A4DC